MPWQAAALAQGNAPATLAAAYANPDWLEIFEEFLKDSLVSENLEFVLAVDGLAGADEAHEIYYDYVKAGAPKEINIKDDMRKAIDAHFPNQDRRFPEPGDPPAGVFDAARKEVWALMVSNYFDFTRQLRQLRPEQPAAGPDDVDEELQGVAAGEPMAPPLTEEEPATGVEAAAWGEGYGQIGGEGWGMTEAEAALLQEPVAAEGDLSFLADGWHGTDQEEVAGDASDEWGSLSGRERSGGYGYGADETEHDDGTEGGAGDLVIMD
jgi:hypothetical protein